MKRVLAGLVGYPGLFLVFAGASLINLADRIER